MNFHQSMLATFGGVGGGLGRLAWEAPMHELAVKNSVNTYVTKSAEWAGILSWIKTNFPS